MKAILTMILITYYSDLLLKLLESVISKLFILIIWACQLFQFSSFKKEKKIQKVFSGEKNVDMSDQRNHLFQ